MTYAAAGTGTDVRGTVRAEERAARRQARRQRNEPPKRSLLEEIGSSVTHGVGALASVFAIILLLRRADTPQKTAAAVLYGACMFLMFLMSCLYHAFRRGSTVKRLWRRFDYSSIYLLIGGTFAPLLLVYLGTKAALIVFWMQWAVIAAGITLIGIFGPGTLHLLHEILYVALGWCGLMFLPVMVTRTPALFGFILAGGIVYTLGIIPFAMHKKGAHFLWHFFVLAGALIHFIGILLYVY